MKSSKHIILALACLLVGCSRSDAAQRSQNCTYIQDTLGSIVLDFKEEHGHLPDSFEEAHKDSGVVLPNRGDAFGRSLIYKKTGEDSFYFLSYGPNNEFEDGLGDDLKVEYQSGWLAVCVTDQ